MIIDAHTHLGNGGVTDMRASAEELLRAMDDAGVDQAVVLAGRLNGCTNAWMLEQVAPHRDRLLPVGAVSVHGPAAYGDERAEALDAMLAAGDLVGLKFYPGYEPYYPHEAWLRPHLALLAKHRRPAVFHCGDLYNKVAARAKLKYAHPLELDALAAEMPGLTIVMAHMGNPFITEGAAVCLSKPNVYADLSGFVYGDFDDGESCGYDHAAFKDAVARFVGIVGDTDRLLFGSDWPIARPASYVDATERAIRALGTRGLDLDPVMHATAARLFGPRTSERP